MLRNVAPNGQPTSYDRRLLSLYAALLDADTAGEHWRETAISLMGLDPNHGDIEHCWRSHLDRARWIVGEGLHEACDAFGS
ncbi:hypothetical protein K663_16135 [Sphingobium sp. MI1205]|nr:hypothetical protein K663_16135 [Sphingobium sp. MI1205]